MVPRRNTPEARKAEAKATARAKADTAAKAEVAATESDAIGARAMVQVPEEYLTPLPSEPEPPVQFI